MQGHNTLKKRFKEKNTYSYLKQEFLTPAGRGSLDGMPKQKVDNDDEKLQNIFMKPFKISGKIGKAGQKDSFTCRSLIFQKQNGLRKGYSEINIIDGVI